MWIVGILSDLKVEGLGLIGLYFDNKAGIHIVANPIFHERIKHIEINCHFVRDYLTKWIIAIKFTISDTQLADVFTKALNNMKL